MTRKDIYRAARLCPLFEGLTDEEAEDAFRYFSAQEQYYAKDDELLSLGQRVDRFALVLSGGVHVQMDDMNGLHMLMATVLPGQTFGESLCFRKTERSPVYAKAFENTEVLWLSTDYFDSGRCVFCMRFMALLTRKTLEMNDRIQVLSKLTLREKLTAFLSQRAQREGAEFDIPMNREALAAYLGVNRSALSREISSMKKEGLLETDRNHFKILT